MHVETTINVDVTANLLILILITCASLEMRRYELIKLQVDNLRFDCAKLSKL